MDRGDAEQEGITLPPVLSLRAIIRDEIQSALIQHLGLCPLARDDVQKRLRSIELTINRLIGFMLGSALIGGAAGGAIQHILHN